ncbi:MAG: hypothetical protein HYU77_00965 [Betaproteobacteria bacterium]|nr:hypothetical protein [Betaproteobacteria bacterium]
MTVTIAFNVALLYLVAANVLLILGYVLFVRHRRRRRDAGAREIADTVVAFFARNDLGVTADCYPVVEGRRYEAAIETEPHKKLRCSYIIEQALIKHVQRTTGKRLDRVFWRFPISRKPEEAAEASVAAAGPSGADADSYLTDGFAQAQITYQVDEGSWEQFEAARRGEREIATAGGA